MNICMVTHIGPVLNTIRYYFT